MDECKEFIPIAFASQLNRWAFPAGYRPDRQFSRVGWEPKFVPRVSDRKEIKVPYRAYQPAVRPPDAVIIKLYTSGDQIRGYVRKIVDPAENDTIFPGEEMEPEAAFKLATSHSEAEAPIFVELTEGVQWDPTWGELLP